MSVWAIVIALNEVLFAAQPFTLTSIASAMPHTLIFSVILSAAVYLAKRKIIDAVEKGRPIDKKFVAELTPQVGHELNSMRRKIEAMDKKQGKGRHPNNGRKTRNFPSDSELAESNKQMLKSNRETYERLYKNAEAEVRKEQKKEEKARAKANAKAQKEAEKEAKAAEKEAKAAEKEAKAAQKKAEKEARAQAALAEGADAVKKKGWFGHRKSESVGDPNDFMKEAHAQMLEQQQKRTEEALRRKREEKLAATAPSRSDLQDRKAQIAREKELQKERREAQLAALGDTYQEDKAVFEAQAKEQAEQAARETARKREKAAAAAAAKAAEEANAKAEAERRAKALKKAREDAIARAKARAKVIAQAAASQNKPNIQPQVTGRNVRGAAQQRTAPNTANIYQSEASARQPRQNKITPVQYGSISKQAPAAAPNSSGMGGYAANTSTNDGLAYLMNEARNASSKAEDKPGNDYYDNVQIPSNVVDTSSLKKTNPPKRGAGLDTSALKRATLPGANRNNEASFNGGFLKSEATRSNASMSSRPMQGTASRPNAAQAGAAMRATLQNDTTLERGKANTQEFASYQANARERALARAQVPKSAKQTLNPATSNRPAAPAAVSSSVRLQQTAARSQNRQAADARRRGPIGIGTTVAPSNYAGNLGAGVQNIGSDAAVARRVVTTSNTVQAGPPRDTMPKVMPSDPLSNIQTAPVMRGRGSVSAQKRDNLLKPEVKFVDESTASSAASQVIDADAPSTNLTGTDKIHAKANAATYQQMQKSAPKSSPLAQSEAKRKRVRPSDKLRADESV